MLFDRSAPVLLVEPRASATKIMSDLLLNLGFETIETVDGSTAALEILHEKGPRLVIVDLHIEPMNGLQVLRAIRADDKLKRTPFIIAAESLSPVEALAIKNAGVDSFLLKPFRAEELERKVEAALLARPSVRTLAEPTTNKSLTAALGRRFERYRP
jgi:two-component system chemotaxis response regulator CheY